MAKESAKAKSYRYLFVHSLVSSRRTGVIAAMTSADIHVLVRINDGEAALPRQDVAEILPLARLDRPPAAPRALAGFLNLGGVPLPVLRLGVLLGGAPPETDDLYSHIVRLKPTEDRPSVGLLVERVLDTAVQPSAAEPVSPDESLNGVVAAQLSINGRFVHGLDAQRLLLAEETVRLAEMTTAMAERLAEWSAA
ncbi:Positive regulator of CheA protein activity (CheW) [Caulobacter sp. RHG1]|nr:Positive regulator of CheA protein activity (CheW) [Caulobacter sp. RHG1]